MLSILSALLLGSLAIANEAQAPKATSPKAAAGITLPKEKFAEGLRASMPGAFCAPATYFRQCFPADEATCRKQVAEALTPCLAENEKDFPALFKQPNDGQIWGEKVGTCVGLRFETALAATKKDTPDCRDETKWK